MISDVTWPNFRAGTSRDGVEYLMRDQGYADDVKYGRSKVFVRSPKTIVQLEEVGSAQAYKDV